MHVVNRDVGEMPEGAHYSDDNDADERPVDDPHRALDINLDEYVICIICIYSLYYIQIIFPLAHCSCTTKNEKKKYT